MSRFGKPIAPQTVFGTDLPESVILDLGHVVQPVFEAYSMLSMSPLTVEQLLGLQVIASRSGDTRNNAITKEIERLATILNKQNELANSSYAVDRLKTTLFIFALSLITEIERFGLWSASYGTHYWELDGVSRFDYSVRIRNAGTGVDRPLSEELPDRGDRRPAVTGGSSGTGNPF